jgi:hypothetical protein
LACAVVAEAATAPVDGSPTLTLLPAALSVTVCEIDLALSLKKNYMSASLRWRVFTLRAVSGESSVTSRSPMAVLSAVPMAAGTICGVRGAVGGYAGGVGEIRSSP